MHPARRYAALALLLVCAVVSLGAAPAGETEAKRSLAEQVHRAMAIAQFEAAASLAEQYAARYPNDAEAPAMLATAYRLRRGLGHADLAQAALGRFDRTYRRGAGAPAAELLRARIELAPVADDLGLMQAFVARHGPSLAPDERAVVEAQLAQEQRRVACETGLLIDLCLWRSSRYKHQCADCDGRYRVGQPRPKPPPPPPRCAHPWSHIRRVTARHRGHADAASRRFAAVLAADRIEFPGLPPERRAAFDDAVAMSALYLTDVQFEALLTTERPADLQFTFAEPPTGAPTRRWYLEQLRARERSVRRLRDYFERSDRVAGELERRYGEIVAANRSTAWTIAALARLAQVSDYRADVAYADALPEGLTRPGDVAAYCELARAYAEPLYERALAAYARCVEVSTAAGVFTEYTQACEEVLAERAPQRFPALAEPHGRPGATESPPVSFGLQLDPGLDE